MKMYIFASFIFISSNVFAQNAELKIRNDAVENNDVVPEGFKLNRLHKKSPLYKAGARDGDNLLKVGGKKIETVTGFGEVFKVLSSPEKPTPVVISRDGKEKTILVTPKAK